MARVFPQAAISSPYMSTERETFTVWMKSLVYQTNGLTVYNSNGEIIYRVENYDKSSNEVHIMDLHGNILFTIRKKNMNSIKKWINLFATTNNQRLYITCHGYDSGKCLRHPRGYSELSERGYKKNCLRPQTYSHQNKLWLFGSWYVYRECDGAEEVKPFVRVKRSSITDGDWEVRDETNEVFWILRFDPKFACQIIGINGDIIAQVKPKQSSNGITLGEDVLTLEVKPRVDHSLVVTLITVYGLIQGVV